MNLSKLSSFVSYDLTAVEERAAYTYNEAQIAGIQNQIAAAAEELLKQPLDEDDTDVPAIKKRAYLRGQITFGKYLLSLHDALMSGTSNSQDNSQEGNDK